MRPAILATMALLSFALGDISASQPTRQPLYWQDPDGKPFYAAGPKKNPDGRDYRPMFDDSAKVIQSKPPAAERRILYYRNPMGLPDTSPKPKKDPMGMDYLPVFAGESSLDDPPGTVRIAPGRLQTLGVRTAPAELGVPSGRAIRAAGIVQFDERHLATVTTKVAGWIERLVVTATGDSVRKGEVLAEIYSPDLVASEEEFLVAARMGDAMASAALQRLRALDVSEDEIARLRRTQKPSRRIAILAPFDGVVIDKPVQQGMRVNAGDVLYRTADLSSVWLIAQVQEQDFGAVTPGQSATAVFVAFPGRTFDGKVDFIYPSLSADTRTARVRIVVANTDGALRASMFATITLEGVSGTKPVLSIPNSAILDSGTRQIVLVDLGEGRFEPKSVKIGARGDERCEITDGLKPGDRVVVGANFLIDAESNLRAALQAFTAGAKP